MPIGVIGVNFKTAPLELREALSLACSYAFHPNSIGKKLENIVLLSTCNRTEIYFSANDLAEKHSEILCILRELVEVPFEQKLYSFFGSDCFLHLATVASGLDSAILAETEISEQVRRAYATSCRADCLDGSIHFFFQKSLKISKSIRTHFPLPRGLASLESMLLELSLNSGMNDILLVGNSQINRQIINVFQRKEKFSLTLCTRSVEGAEEFASQRNLSLASWDALEDWQRWDIVICATQHRGYLIHECTSEKPHLLVDLSVPRVIDPTLSSHPQTRLLNMEEIATLVDGKRRRLLEKIDESQAYLQKSVHSCLASYQQKLLRKPTCINF
jgi:glutamyl-tRNA reductase